MLEASKGTLAASMALTRRLMGDLQRVESAEVAIEIKINLRAELARRQEAVDAVKISKGSGIKKYWKTTSPFGVRSVPHLKESTQVAPPIRLECFWNTSLIGGNALVACFASHGAC
jgi:hypothetical protein